MGYIEDRRNQGAHHLNVNEGVPYDVKFTSVVTNDSFMPAPTTTWKLSPWTVLHQLRQIRETHPVQFRLCDQDRSRTSPSRYFYRERQRIKIQIRVTLIAKLLITLLQRRLERQWSFSGLVTMVRIVQMYYINLNTFFEKPDEDLKRMLREAAEHPPKEAVEE